MSVPDRVSDAVTSSSLRRAVLALALASLVVTAGCSALPGSGGGGASTSPALDTVPAGADFVGYVNVQGMRNDDSLRNIGNEMLRAQANRSGYEGPENVDEAISQAESESDLDPTKLAAVTVYGQYPDESSSPAGPSYSAAVLSTSWSEEEFVTAVENDSELTLEQTTYADATLYRPADSGNEDAWIGVAGDTQFVVGTEQAVKDALDTVSNGDAVSGDLRTRFTDTDEGYVRFASAVPQDQLPSDGLSGSGRATSDLSAVSGSLSTDGDTVSVTVTMAYGSESAASDARDVFKGAVTTYRGLAEDEQTKQLLSEDHLSIEKDGSDVVVTSTNDADTLSTLMQRLYGMEAGGSASGSASPPGVSRSAKQTTSPTTGSPNGRPRSRRSLRMRLKTEDWAALTNSCWRLVGAVSSAARKSSGPGSPSTSASRWHMARS